MHFDPDLTGSSTTFSPDGQLRLVVVFSGQGDFIRLNPDGTWTMELVEPKAPLTVSVLSNGDWVTMWVGNGSVHDTFLGQPMSDGSFIGTGEALHLHVEGKLTNVLDGSKWSLLWFRLVWSG